MTPAAPPRSRPASFLWLSVGLALVAAVVARLSFLGERFNNDAGLYAAMGKAVHDGHQLYVELWDTKLPGITLLTAPLYAVFGDRWWAWVTSQLLTGVAAAVVLALAVRHVARRSGVDGPSLTRATLGTLAVGLVLLNLHRILISGFQLETPMTLCTVAAAYGVIRALAAGRGGVAWALFAGGMAGLGATLKPTGLAVAGAAGVTLVVMAIVGDRRWWRFALAAALGLAAVVAVNLAWFARLDAWPHLPEAWREIRLYGSGTPWSQAFSIKTGVIFAVVLWPLVAIGISALLRAGASPPRPDSDRGRSGSHLIVTFAIAWLAFEVLGVIAQKRVYAYHFLPVAAPVALIVGLLVAARRLGAVPIAAAVVPLAVLTFATSVGGWRGTLRGDGDRRAIVAYLVAHTRPDDRIFADPVGALSVLADRRPGSRIGMLIHFVNHDGAPEKFSRLVIDDLEHTRCEVIVLPIPPVLAGRIANWETQPVLAAHPDRRERYRAAWERFLDYVRTHYTLEQADIDGEQVWRRLP